MASKFIVINDAYCGKLKSAAETLYAALAKYDAFDVIDNTDDCACAIFLLAGLKELGKDPQMIATAFEANISKVQVLLSYVVSGEQTIREAEQEERKDETD